MAEFTIASRDLSVPFAEVQKSVNSVLQSFPAASIVRSDSEIGVVVVQVPDDQIPAIRTSLGDGFSIDPNSSLTILR
jgi:hypothetical protein